MSQTDTLLWSLEEVSLLGRRSPRLDRVTAQISRGVTAIVGRSGAGKTSLLNVLVQFELPSQGKVAFRNSLNAIGTPPSVFWSPPTYGLWSHLTVREHLETVHNHPANLQNELPRPLEVNRVDASVDGLLSAFDLRELESVRPRSLSLGERSRLSVARALASGAEVLVMDEPLAHVDPGRVGDYWNTVRYYCATTETSLVFATHTPEIVLREASSVLCLSNGSSSYCGSVTELYNHPPSSELAVLLGPCNWMPREEATRWLESEMKLEEAAAGSDRNAICLRPERLRIEVAPEGRSLVEASRFAGSTAEVDLVDEQDGRRRTFFHRPSGPSLRPGDRVLLKMIIMLLMALIVGCTGGSSAEEPVLRVKRESFWFMPPDGPRVPAPRGMTVSPDGEYLVLDNAGRVLAFDETGKLQRQWWMPETSVGKPEGITVLKDGRIAVADTHYHRVVLFSHDGKVADMFGKQGIGPGEFEFPVSVIQDDKENLYVCEYGNFNDRAQKFRPDGTFVAQIGSYGTGDGQFQRPSGAAWYEGRLYIVDAFNNRVQIFEENGKLVEILGKSDKMAELYYPYDISVNDRGELFVVEYGAGRVSKFDRSGKLLGRYGRTGQGNAQFSTPWGMAIDRRGRVYVCDTGNRRIVELEL